MTTQHIFKGLGFTKKIDEGEEEELAKYHDKENWTYQGTREKPTPGPNVQPPVGAQEDTSSSPEVEAVAEELAEGAKAWRDYARLNSSRSSAVFEELAEEIDPSDSGSEDPKQIGKNESWESFKQRRSGEVLNQGERTELEDLALAARARSQQGSSSSRAFWDYMSGEVDGMVESEANVESPSDQLREKEFSAEELQIAADSFRARGEETGKDHWLETAAEYEELSRGLEGNEVVEYYEEIDTKLIERPDGSAKLVTSHSGVREELQEVAEADNGSNVHQISDKTNSDGENELTVEIDDVDEFKSLIGAEE